MMKDIHVLLYSYFKPGYNAQVSLEDHADETCPIPSHHINIPM